MSYLVNRAEGVWLTHRTASEIESIDFKPLGHLERLTISSCGIKETTLLGVRDLTTLQWLDLSCTAEDKPNLAFLETLHDLKVFHVSGRGFGDEELRHVSTLKNLDNLSLAETAVTSAGMLHLQKLGALGILDIDDTYVRDPGLEHLQAIKSLRLIYVGRYRISSAAITRLKQAIPKLKVLEHY